jgi:LuxR family maltose regulon positive regulatory protein
MVEAGACITQLDQLARSNSHPSRSISLEFANYRALGAASVAAAQHRTEEATVMLSAALQSAEGRHGDALAIRLRTTLALVWLAANERTRAIEVFREVLKVAATARVYQFILDMGPDIGELLHAVSDKEIANTLGIGAETVKSHVKSIFTKLDVDQRAQAVARVRDLGLAGPY